MKNLLKRFVGLSLSLLLLLGAVTFADDSNYGAQGADNKEVFTIEEMLNYAIEDEYLARAEYEKIMETFGEQRPFSNIINAEETHIELLMPLFETYDIDLNVDSSKEYVVIPETIQDALKVGVQAEIDNIAMYEKFLEQELPEDIQVVFERLKEASENHLRAFQRSGERNNRNGRTGLRRGQR